MKIFSEIYNVYYRIAARLLSLESFTKRDLFAIINEEGFRDSRVFLSKKLLPQKDNSDWRLFEQVDEERLSGKIGKPPHIMSRLQKMWLKAKLDDPRMRLFLNDDVIENLKEGLKEVEPLYAPEHFRIYDRFSEGDDYSNAQYREGFRTILKAVKERRILKIGFTAESGERGGGLYLPLKLEYSERNDNFRVCCWAINDGEINRDKPMLINLGNIDRIVSEEIYDGDVPGEDDFFNGLRASEPIKVRVSRERNAVMRFLNEFSEYEKRVFFNSDPENGCTVELYYDKQDERELLTQLLGFGARAEIISPQSVRNEAAKLVRRQIQLLKNELRTK